MLFIISLYLKHIISVRCIVLLTLQVWGAPRVENSILTHCESSSCTSLRSSSAQGILRRAFSPRHQGLVVQRYVPWLKKQKSLSMCISYKIPIWSEANLRSTTWPIASILHPTAKTFIHWASVRRSSCWKQCLLLFLVFRLQRSPPWQRPKHRTAGWRSKSAGPDLPTSAKFMIGIVQNKYYCVYTNKFPYSLKQIPGLRLDPCIHTTPHCPNLGPNSILILYFVFNTLFDLFHSINLIG